MRAIRDHVVEGDSASRLLTILVMDEPGAGGANHHYHLDWLNDQSWKNEKSNSLEIQFQNGPIQEVGVNGVTNEALLAIVIDRLKSFQAGPFACLENADAQLHCEAALDLLKLRTLRRMARGVEGRLEK